MKKNIKKGFSAVLSLTLVASVLAPVGNVFAATPDLAKRYGNVYEGGTYKYTTKNSKGMSVKWTVTGAAKSSVKLSKKTGTSNSIKINTNGGKVGNATVEARFYKKVKKNGKNVYQLVKKRVDKVSVKVSAKSVNIVNKVSSLKVNEEMSFNYTLTPSNSTSKTYWSVTTKDGKETQDAFVNSDGIFKATKAGEYTVTVTARNSATAKVRSVDSFDVKVVDSIVSVSQLAANKLNVEFTSDVKVNKELFKVYDVNNVNCTIKDVVQNGNIVTLEFFSNLPEKSTYTINYGDMSFKFVTTDGVVTNIVLDKMTVIAGEETAIKALLKDSNQVTIKEVPIGSVGKEEVIVNTNNGYVSNGKLTLFKAGDKAEVKVKYHTYEYDNATGLEKGVIERTFEVTAIEKGATVVKESKYTIVKKNEGVNFATLTRVNTQLPQGGEYDLHILAKDTNNKVVDYFDFVSSDNNALIITEISKNKVSLRGNKLGTYYVLAKDDKGNIIAQFPVVIVAEAKTTSIVTDKEFVNLGATYLNDSAKVKVEFKDQYGNKSKEGLDRSRVVNLSKPDGADISNIEVAVENDCIVFTNKSGNLKDGVYKYKYTTENNLVKVITVNVQKPVTTSASVVAKTESPMLATVDTDTDYSKNYNINLDIVGANGVALGTAKVVTENTDVSAGVRLDNNKFALVHISDIEVKNSKGQVVYTVKANANRTAFEENLANIPTSLDAKAVYDNSKGFFNVDTNGKFVVSAVKLTGNDFTRLSKDNYTVKITYDMLTDVAGKTFANPTSASNIQKGRVVTTGFVVTDNTINATATKVKESVNGIIGNMMFVDGVSITPDVKNLVTEAFEFNYMGEKILTPLVEKVYGYKGSNAVYINKVDVKVVLPNGKTIISTIDVNSSISVK